MQVFHDRMPLRLIRSLRACGIFIFSLPPCGGGLGWGVSAFHPNPPPQGGREFCQLALTLAVRLLLPSGSQIEDFCHSIHEDDGGSYANGERRKLVLCLQHGRTTAKITMLVTRWKLPSESRIQPPRFTVTDCNGRLSWTLLVPVIVAGEEAFECCRAKYVGRPLYATTCNETRFEGGSNFNKYA